MHRFADSPLANILSFTYKTKQALHISQFFFSVMTQKSLIHDDDDNVMMMKTMLIIIIIIYCYLDTIIMQSIVVYEN